MNNKAITSFRIIWRIIDISEGVIRRGRNTLLDLHNSSWATQPHSLSVKYIWLKPVLFLNFKVREIKCKFMRGQSISLKYRVTVSDRKKKTKANFFWFEKLGVSSVWNETLNSYLHSNLNSCSIHFNEYSLAQLVRKSYPKLILQLLIISSTQLTYVGVSRSVNGTCSFLFVTTLIYKLRILISNLVLF